MNKLEDNPLVVKAVGVIGMLLLIFLGTLIGRQLTTKSNDTAAMVELRAVSQKLDRIQHDCQKP